MSAAVEMGAGAPRHFLELRDFDPAQLRALVDAAAVHRRTRKAGKKPLAGKTIALIFEKPSTRTRVSFEVAMRELGGDVITLSAGDLQLGRGETIADTARVLSRYVDAIMLRTGSAEKLYELAAHASVPVINGLTERSHPCQVLADVLTFETHRGPIAGQTIAWLGDGNNVAATWIEAAALLGVRLRLACPDGYRPKDDVLAWAKGLGGDIVVTPDPLVALSGARAVMTDTWISMNDKDDEAEAREAIFAPYQVTARMMAAAAGDAIFMHCLPAYRGEEVTAEVIDGPASVVFDEAENRVHAQKAVLMWSLG